MPVRNRRVRLLLLAIFLVTAALLYSRPNKATIAEVKYYAERSYQHAIDSTYGKPKSPSPAKSKNPDPIAPAEPKKDEQPFKVDFEAYSKGVVAQETSVPAVGSNNEVVANPNPMVGVNAGPQDGLAAAAAKPTTKAGEQSAKEKQALLQADQQPERLGEGRHESDPPAAGAAPVHWTKLPENFPVSSTIKMPTGAAVPIPKIQHDFKTPPGSSRADEQRLAAIKAATKHSWDGYWNKAMGHDEVKPVSGKHSNPFMGWGATLVDALDTLWIMGMTTEFEEAVEFVKKIDFTTSPRGDIPVFETTIRYLGGLLGAYDISGRKYKVLLDKAIEIGDILYGAFDTPNRMPITYYEWKPAYASQGHRAANRAIMAEIGSLSLEFTRLAQLTSNQKYYDAVARVTDALDEFQDKTRIPGLWPTILDASGCKKSAKTSGDKQSSSGEKKSSSGPVAKADSDAKGATQSDPKSSKNLAGSSDSAILSTNPGGLPNSGSSLGAMSNAGTIPNVGSSANEGAGTGPSNIGGKEPGLGKIQGFGNPIEEGSLDSKPAKEAALYKAASGAAKAAKRAFNAIKGAPSDTMNLVKRAMGEVGSAREDAPYYAPLEVPTTTSTAAATAQTSKSPMPVGDDLKLIKDGAPTLPEDPSLRKEQPKAPASKDDALSRKDIPTVPKEDIAARKQSFREYKVPSPSMLTGSEVCTPQGLASSHLYASEIFSLGAAADSTYEYLPKMHLLLQGKHEQYRKMYVKAIEASIDWLIYRPMIPDEKREILFAGNVDTKADSNSPGEYEKDHRPIMTHLTCFVGGMFAMGGKIFDRPADVEMGRKLTDGCIWAYNATVTGIMPEVMGLVKCKDPKNCKWDQEAYYRELDPMESLRMAVKSAAPALPALPAATGTPALAAQAAATQALALGALGAHEAPQAIAAPDAPGAKAFAKRQLGEGLQYGIQTAAAVAPTDVPPAPKAAGQPVANVPAAGDKSTSSAPAGVPAQQSVNTPAVGLSGPPAPLPHAEYVKAKIQDERLPPGFVGAYDRKYGLRPEAIESVVYMWRISGDQYWRDRGWEMFQATYRATWSTYGASAIDDVTKHTPDLKDTEESFWLAETLKYYYLLFDDPDRISLDDYVLNTEAHFFQRTTA